MTMLCLNSFESGDYGAVYCADNYCIEPATNSCVPILNASSIQMFNNRQGRRQSDHHCVGIYQQEDVDFCGEGLCIDFRFIKSQCIHLKGQPINMDGSVSKFCSC